MVKKLNFISEIFFIFKKFNLSLYTIILSYATLIYPIFKKKFSFYDISLDFNLDYKELNKFLNNKNILDKFNLNRKWELINYSLFSKFTKDWFYNTTNEINNLLKNKIKVILSYGKDDFLCNYLGARNYISRIKKFMSNININNKYLTYLEISNSNHVIYDKQPQIGVNLLDKLLDKNN